jgi:hypothetical protein
VCLETVGFGICYLESFTPVAPPCAGHQ